MDFEEEIKRCDERIARIKAGESIPVPSMREILAGKLHCWYELYQKAEFPRGLPDCDVWIVYCEEYPDMKEILCEEYDQQICPACKGIMDWNYGKHYVAYDIGYRGGILSQMPKLQLSTNSREEQTT